MTNLKLLRQRIKSAKNTFQITRAMKLVSAAKLRRAQEKVSHARIYSQEIEELIQKIRHLAYDYQHPFIEKRKKERPHQKILVVLMTADRGLAGSFNNAIIKTASKLIQSHPDSHFEFICIGKKGLQFCQRGGYKVLNSLIGQQNHLHFQTAHNIGRKIQQLYLDHQIDSCFICYSKFHSPIKQEPLIDKLFPIEFSQQPNLNSPQIAFEPNPKEILDGLINHYLNICLYQAIKESIASEHGARMSAMSNSTENATKMINKLTIINNRERQTRITKEISEIVGGAEALRI